MEDKLKEYGHEHEHQHDHGECECGCEHEHHDHDHHHDHEECGCGHDHHEHEHDHDREECGCGHDHHDHEHHHDREECGCGHDHHDHEHHHDREECGCGHDHHDHDECGCGHDHHHDHDECGCGHDHHEHDHQHDHGECGCGHDHHEHEHHHDHGECGCGHDHHDHNHHAPTRQPADFPGNGLPRKIYILENLGCAHCAAKMEERIGALPGVEYASITYATKQLRISAKNPDQYLPEIRRICTEIESAVVVKEREERPTKSSDQKNGSPSAAGKKRISQDTVELFTILGGAALYAVGIILERIGYEGLPSILLYVAAYIVLGGEVLLEACRNISHGQVFDENFLMSIATLGAFVIREYPEAVGVMLFYRIGEFFEHKAVSRSRSQIMDAVDMRPEVVNLLSGDEVRVIPAEEAKAGDLLLVRPGDRIPLDGVVTEGESRIDTSPITGEPVPVAVAPGSPVTSGCVNTSGQLKLRVEKPLSESMVTRILDSVENAAASKPKIDRFITRFSKVYTPCVVFGAIAVALIPSLITGEWHYWIYTALTFLVMSCPCALVLSVPLAFFSGIGAGSKKGILFKGGVSIEALNGVKAVVMDKTGTVTKGNFLLQEIIPEGSRSREELLRICASCEQNSTHPIACSIVSAAEEKGIALETPSSLEEIAGHGISAALKAGKILCGNRKLMEQNQVPVPESQGGSWGAEVFLAVNGTYAGRMVISDTIKEDAKEAVRRMKAQGLRTVMLTGDSEDSARAVAGETGIDEVHAKLLPQDKLTALQDIRKNCGSVLFVGDGINDAPVLAGADVGAAMGSGADAAIEAADAVYMNSSVESIPDSIAIARATNRIAVQNVVFALVIKLAVMVLGLAGFANMWMAVFADTGVAMLCILNSIRILYKK